MSKTKQSPVKQPAQKLNHPDFWKRMEINSRVVAKMPQWVKGSPVNHRGQNHHNQRHGPQH